MALIKSEAFLLRKIPFRNSSFILDILTQTDGRISLIAKGARREKSPFFTRLEYLYSIQIVFIRKSSGMGILTECTVRNLFARIRNNPLKAVPSLIMLRLIREVCGESGPEPGMFSVLSEFMSGFAGVSRENITVYRLYALFRMIEEAGYSPSVETCTGCGRQSPLKLYYETGTDTLQCSFCAVEKKGKKTMELSPDLIKIIRLSKNRDISSLFRLKPGKGQLDAMERFELLFLSSVLGKNITALTPGTYNEK